MYINDIVRIFYFASLVAKMCFINNNSYITGEWFNSDPEAIINQALQTGGGPNVSDAYTINGHPGPLYNCSAKGVKYSTNICIYKYI